MRLAFHSSDLMFNRALLSYLGKSKKYVRLSMLFLTLRNLSLAGMALIFGRLIAAFVKGAEAGWRFWEERGLFLLLLFALLWLLRAFSAYLGTATQAVAVGEVKQNLRTALLDKLFRMGSRYQYYAGTANVINMGTDTVEQLENYFGRYLSELYTCILTSALLFVLFLFINLRTALLFLLLAPIIPLFLLGMLSMVKRMQSKYWRKYRDVGRLFLDSLQGITTLKIFNADGRRASELAEKSEQFRLETMKILKMQLTSITLIEWVAYGGGLGLMLLAGHEFAAGRLWLSELIAMTIIVFEAFRPMISLTSSFHVAMTGIAAGEKLLAFLDEDIPESHGQLPVPEAKAIRAENLTYTYPQSSKKVLDHVSFVFQTHSQKPGFSAVAGPSGSGKSTLAKIISGEIPVFGESMFFGETSYADLDPASLASRVTRIGHEVHIFEGTVRDNLAMASEDEEAMLRALEAVKLWDEIRDRGGLDLELTINAENLSGGQKQRLAIARALLNDSAVYIFDEATSNIDIESEGIILALIEALSKQKQVIVITHRLYSIRHAEQILVLDQGRTVGRGSHETLMREEEGLYRRMYEAQQALEAGKEAAL